MSESSRNHTAAEELAAILLVGQESGAVLESTPADEVVVHLETVLETYLRQREGGATERSRQDLLAILDAGRWPSFLRKISGQPLAERWLTAVLRAIDQADIGIGDLLRLRAGQQPGRTQIQIPAGRTLRGISRAELGERVRNIGSGLCRHRSSRNERVHLAMLSPNRLEAILVDLACMSEGIVNVPIAADSTPEQIRFILERTRPEIFVVSDQQRLDTVLTGGTLPSVRTIVLMDRPDSEQLDERIHLLSDVEEEGRKLGVPARGVVRSHDLATIMFTSGTTGRPKGIRFSQRNIVYKRFCRAVALPEIGEEDVFLCYLPLFHTFGRYLEMTGSLFWGAIYSLMENPSREAILESMHRLRPSVFISIPKRWIEIHERIIHIADPAGGDPTAIDPLHLASAVKKVTGGRLRFGLSAAGHLDPEIFLFFQRHGIDLMSGFGMTEATGGITMTPPGRYKSGTVGLPLPGIETKLEEDGELLIRGPYMMLGYDEEETESNFEENWFPTGDLFAIGPNGYYSIVDRKKDIYKNVKGQTIAPQRVENLFNQFDEIQRVFLVGDGREYNTLLIYPDYEVEEGKLRKMSTEEVREYLSSHVVSVNRFLAPYERVVDFDLLPRFFLEERGELTPKGTFVRKVVERNFSDLIDRLYARSHVSVRTSEVEIRIPNWFLREKGITAEEILSEADGVRIRPSDASLKVARVGGSPARYRIGSLIFTIDRKEEGERPRAVLDLEPFLRVPRLWVGNLDLESFAGSSLLSRPRKAEAEKERIRCTGWTQPANPPADIEKRYRASTRRADRGPAAVHAVAAVLFTQEGPTAIEAVDALERFLSESNSEEAELCTQILPLLRHHADQTVRRRALALLLARDPGRKAGTILADFLDQDPDLLSPEVSSILLEQDWSNETRRSILDLALELDVESDRAETPEGRHRLGTLFRLIGDLGTQHPDWYASVRQVLVVRSMPGRDRAIAQKARAEARGLKGRFRSWISEGWSEPVHPDTGQPLSWDEILGFDDRIDAEVCERLRAALRKTTLLRESVYLLCGSVLIKGSDLIPGGIWVSYLGSGHGKTVVRLTVRTGNARAFEFVVKLMRGIGPEDAAAEVDWMIRLGTRERAVRLVPEFGGYWSELGLWAEEYISNETVFGVIRRMTRQEDPERMGRLVSLWLHLAWSALSTFVEFWHRSGRSVVLAEPVPVNIVVAPHDYQEGSRLVSISSRMPFSTLAEMIRFHFEMFVGSTEKAFPILRGGVDRSTSFAAMIEALGEDSAIPLLWRALSEMREKTANDEDPTWKTWHAELSSYIEQVERDGYAPRRLIMAVRRYRIWTGLNREASLQARAMMLQELYETYRLDDLETSHPEVRIRFFRMTVFAGIEGTLATELDSLIRSHRDVALDLESLLRRMTILHRTCSLNEEESYFLARMTYSHLAPAQKGKLELREEGGETTAELVEEVKDPDGGIIRIRTAATPKEVMRLHHFFEQSGLSVTFRPEHHFLVGLDEDDVVFGGLFYRAIDRETVHMEKIVIAPRYRGRGAGDQLMESFLQRMRDANRSRVTTGFFRPHYFYRFGFRLERGFAGLVKDLRESTLSETTS